jgi:hypothetical protein
MKLGLLSRSSSAGVFVVSARRLVFLMIVVAPIVRNQAFQISISASPRTSNNDFRNPLRRTALFAAAPLVPSVGGISSSLISQLAVIALKMRLKDQTDVSCNVQSKSSDLLLGGRVGPVTVKGKGWRSGLGLTCRAIEATVDTCELDVARVLSKRKLALIHPAKGKAMVALNSIDFGNFMTHPLLKPPALINGDSEIAFCKEGTQVDPTTGTVIFYATTSQESGARWKCVLGRDDADGTKRARIQVSLADEAAAVQDAETISQQMTEALSDFFNKMVFELDGTFLSFRDMMVTDKGDSPSVMLALNIVVHKFPSPGLKF